MCDQGYRRSARLRSHYPSVARVESVASFRLSVPQSRPTASLFQRALVILRPSAHTHTPKKKKPNQKKKNPLIPRI
ncbi:hypothetical protein FJTKL_04262 [Diaporthe vaccinii]|uniref:Mating type protein 1-2-1 n=1 Tax=Diaporthe vaccinii TaxID=105482 RepID=A0ABR4F0D8_9PEZI